jgi:UDP-N-acetylmuramate dehydrogenase
MTMDVTAALADAVDEGRVQRDVPLAPFTTFRVGGPADWLVDVRSVDELVRVMQVTREANVPVTLLGGGSNVLVSDAGVRGVVIRPRLSGIEQVDAATVRAEAGSTMNGLVRWTIARGVSGLEAWAGTPGTVGGAICGNAHYGGRNVSELVARVLIVSRGGALQDIAPEDMAFAYDTSRIQRSREVVVSVDFHVGHAEAAALRSVARQSLAHRKRTQPLEAPSAGCIFQNPDAARDVVPAGLPASAGALVDDAGLKGRRHGGARISLTHANFIVNESHATARDIRALIEDARRAVRTKSGVELRTEVVLLGEWGED